FRDFGNREKARPESGFQSSRNAAPPGQVESLPDSPPDEAGFLVPDFADTIRALHEVRIDLARFRAAVEIGMNDMPAPDPPATAEPVIEEPVVTYLPAVRRALREAAL
ncbi:MAG TPA: hypothetical protein VF174_15960, partial [Micromonosporaceae bacterium]